MVPGPGQGSAPAMLRKPSGRRLGCATSRGAAYRGRWETAGYLRHHLALAGRSDTWFSDDAAALIHQSPSEQPAPEDLR